MNSFQPLNLAKIALEIGALKINADNPFQWASGYQMPVYNDNRLFLGNAEHRKLIGEGLQSLIQASKISANVIAGTATAGIPHATTLANILKVPLVYVRGAPKGHGLENQIEGILHKKQNVVVIEDVISTGGSALKAVEILREAGATVRHCLCIFDYGFQKAASGFDKARCGLHPLFTFETLIQYASDSGIICPEEKDLLNSWYRNPFEWGEKRGFPRIH